MLVPPTGAVAAVASARFDPVRNATQSDKELREVAEKLEASFLSEMLRHTGLGEARESFGGGVGEAQFASFLREVQAQELSNAGGLGLAEPLFQALKRQQNG